MSKHEVQLKVNLDKNSVLKEWEAMVGKMDKEEIKINTTSAKKSIDDLTASMEKLGKTKISSLEKITKQLETFSNSLKAITNIKTTSFDSLNSKFEKLTTSLNSLENINFDNLKTINSTFNKLSKSLDSLGNVKGLNEINKSLTSLSKLGSTFDENLTKSVKNMGSSFGTVAKNLEKISSFTKKDFNKLAQMSDTIGNSIKKMFTGGNQEQFINNIKTVTAYLEQLSKLDTNIAKRIFGENLGNQAQSVGNGLREINRLLTERTSILKQMSTTTNAQSFEALNLQLKNVDNQLDKLGQSYKASGQQGENMVQTMASNFQTFQDKITKVKRELNNGFKMSGGSDQSQSELKELQSELTRVEQTYNTLVRDVASNPIKVMNAFESGTFISELTAIENKMKNLKVTIAGEDKIKNLTTNVDKLNTEFTQAKQMVTGLKINVDAEKLERAKTLLSELSKMKITPTSSAEEITRYINKYEECKRAVQGVTSEVTKLSQHKKIDLNIDNLITKLNKLKGQSAEADAKIDNLVSSLKNLKGESNVNIKIASFGQFKSQASGIQSSLANMQTSMKHTGKMWNNLANALSTYTPIYALSRMITTAFTGSLETIINLDSAMRDLVKVAPPDFSATTAALDEVQNKAIEVGKTVAATSTDVINSTAAALQLGISDIDKALEYAQNSTMYANVSDQDQETADKQLKSILSAYGGVNQALQKNSSLVKGASKDYNMMTNYMDMANICLVVK